MLKSAFIRLDRQERLSLANGTCSQGWDLTIMSKLKRSRASLGNYFGLWHAVNYGPGIKALFNESGRFRWPSSGFSEAVNAPCTSGDIPGRSLFLDMAPCCCLWWDLTQPSHLFQALSITRAGLRVPKAGGMFLRTGCAGHTPTGSKSLGNWPCIGNPRAKQNHHHPHEKPQR